MEAFVEENTPFVFDEKLNARVKERTLRGMVAMWVRIYWKDKKASKEIRRELLDRGKTAARLNWSFRMQVVYKMVQICPGVAWIASACY